uniref:Uncharacterized protein n=1 Tax=Aegilops tauschii TaxID=37682 RepID=M8BNJ6_AEGTA
MAWTLVNLGHFAVPASPPPLLPSLTRPRLLWIVFVYLDCLLRAITYHFFHWKKGTPFADDQGMYNRLTWWEQRDNGKQLTRNRKFLVVVPVVL